MGNFFYFAYFLPVVIRIIGTTTEEHLQGDIAFAFRQYWQTTRDVRWLKESGFPGR
jgi:trehalose/maltose hydrolase-like predicted phosphorylase